MEGNNENSRGLALFIDFFTFVISNLANVVVAVVVVGGGGVVVAVVVGMNRKVIKQLVIYISAIFGERHEMPPHICGVCLKSYMFKDSLKHHMRTKHPTDEIEEKAIKRSKENDGFRNISCNICGQVFGSQNHLETHIRHNKCSTSKDPTETFKIYQFTNRLKYLLLRRKQNGGDLS